MNSDADFSFSFDITGLLELIVFLTVIGWLTGRILGVRRGFWRALIAGLIGLFAGQALIFIQFGSDERLEDLSDAWALGVGFIGYVLLVTMVASVVLEAIMRPRSGKRRLHIPHPIRWISQKFALLQRLWQIGMAARKHGLVGRKFASRTALSSPEGARALRLTLEDCGGMFIKFGQIASSRDDFLPVTITTELGELRSSVTPLPFSVVETVLTEELGVDYREHFSWLNPEPLAAASIGVTHEATLTNGDKVIVKIQRPKVADSVNRDGRVLLWGARQLERGSASARQLGIVDLATELVEGVTEELDFTREAANNLAIRRNRTNDPGVAFPAVLDKLTTKRVLVMDEVDGVSIADHAAVAETGVPAHELADRLLHSYLGQVLTDGVYHADPHPGNILITPDGVMWFIDFGAVGYLDPITLEALQQMAIGFSIKDPGLLARSVRRMVGGEGLSLDIPALEYDMGQVLTHVEGSGFGPSAIAQVIHVLQRHKVRVPRALTVLGRSAVTMEGTLRDLSPGYSMSHAAVDIVKTQARSTDPTGKLKDELIRAIPSLRPLPELTGDLALLARSGQLTMRVDHFAGEDRQVVDRWVDRSLFAGLAMVGLLASALMLIAAALTGDNDLSAYTRAIGFLGLIISSAMQMRVIARILQRQDRPDGG